MERGSPQLLNVVGFVLVRSVPYRRHPHRRLFYFLVIASRNYRAQAHNYIVNKNKQNALSTFETFVKASDNDEIKNAVLLQTTKAIFSNSPSGYLKNESDDDSPTQIIEIVKDVSKLAKP